MENSVDVFATVAKIVSILTVGASASALIGALSQRARENRRRRKSTSSEDVFGEFSGPAMVSFKSFFDGISQRAQSLTTGLTAAFRKVNPGVAPSRARPKKPSMRRFVVFQLEEEQLPDGSLHFSSPQLPAFHMFGSISEEQRLYQEKVLPRFRETLIRRIAEAGLHGQVVIHPALSPGNFTPAGLTRSLHQLNGHIPTEVIAEIS
jgi:hypothetical protein